MKAHFDIVPKPSCNELADNPQPVSSRAFVPPSESEVARVRAGLQALRSASPPECKAAVAAKRIRDELVAGSDFTVVSTSDLLILLEHFEEKRP